MNQFRNSGYAWRGRGIRPGLTVPQVNRWGHGPLGNNKLQRDSQRMNNSCPEGGCPRPVNLPQGSPERFRG